MKPALPCDNAPHKIFLTQRVNPRSPSNSLCGSSMEAGHAADFEAEYRKLQSGPETLGHKRVLSPRQTLYDERQAGKRPIRTGGSQ
jgi:hypothetical protein